MIEVVKENNTGKVSKDDLFHKSYREKIMAQESRIYGLLIIKAENGKNFEIIPMTNINDKSCITYDVSIKNQNGISVLAENTKTLVHELPAGTSGKILVKSYVNGVLNNSVSENYVSF